MLSNIFDGIFDANNQYVISIDKFLLCMGVTLIIGLMIALVYAFRSHYTKSFFITLWILPVVVCVVIMMVNGNIGAGVAVAGAFSLVRFRSIAGNAKEISVIFLAMTVGLIAGMGYLAYAFLFSVVICIVLFVCQFIKLPLKKKHMAEKTLRITIPEDLDYSGLFDEIFAEYVADYHLTSVKTTNMGTMIKLKYNITEKDVTKEKAMIDAIRIKNGNLEVAISEQEVSNEL